MATNIETWSDELLRLIPIICFAVMVSYVFWLRHSLRLAAITAMALPDDDTVQGWLGRVYRVLIGALGAIVIIDLLMPGLTERYFGSIPLLKSPLVEWVGALCIIFGSSIVIWGQHSLGLSWRIGIRENEVPELVKLGAFRFSRNPIFLGILLGVGGYILHGSNALVAIIFAMIFIALNVQIREEEAYLGRKLGSQYETWKASNFRWFGVFQNSLCD